MITRVYLTNRNIHAIDGKRPTWNIDGDGNLHLYLHLCGAVAATFAAGMWMYITTEEGEVEETAE